MGSTIRVNAGERTAALFATPRPLTPWQRRIVWISVLVGAVIRFLYVMILHRATDHVYSDMQDYLLRALRYFGTERQQIDDTIHPPGTAIFLAILHRLDVTWNVEMLVQWLLSLGVMALVWLIARRLYGTTTAAVALAIASLYFPFVHYAGLYLAENPFAFFSLLALWLFVLAIDARNARHTALHAVLAGVATGLAISFKNSLFAPLLLLGVIYVAYAIKYRRPNLAVVIVSAVVGLCILAVPMTVRCTRLNEGRVCPTATNFASNVLMGHYGEKGAFRWHDRRRGFEFTYESPSTVERGYTEAVDLDFGVYDAEANLALARDWIRDHPARALRLSFMHVYDLFGGPTLWPRAELWNIDFGVISQWTFWLLVLPAAFARTAVRAPSMLRLDADSLPEWILFAPLLGLMGTVFLTLGEVRYRVPFDGLFIILAARAYVSVGRSVSRHLSAARNISASTHAAHLSSRSSS
ncbi:MAG TPA: glycosyltransferase family 39 protein [Casimicrobiaceae bacterium]|nr:glycosyltransferase family 39 protein [Casimicrobiaceae bacterium]